MPDSMLLGIEEKVLSLEVDENPADNFPCMPCLGVHAEMRTQLYATLMGVFYDEAESMEQLALEYGPYGPYVFKLDYTITERLAEIEEDDIPGMARIWAESADMSALNLADEDLQDVLASFLFNLIHFCMLVRQQPVLSVFIFSDG